MKVFQTFIRECEHNDRTKATHVEDLEFISALLECPKFTHLSPADHYKIIEPLLGFKASDKVFEFIGRAC